MLDGPFTERSLLGSKAAAAVAKVEAIVDGAVAAVLAAGEAGADLGI